MIDCKTLRWRKATDINSENDLYELMQGNDALLDLGFSDSGSLEVSFNPFLFGKAMPWADFRVVIEEGVKLAEANRACSVAPLPGGAQP